MKKPTNFEMGFKAHRQWLLGSYKKLAQKLLSKAIDEKQFAKELTTIHLQLEDLADRDSLIPHFYNFKGFQKALPQALQLTTRLKIPGSLLILDVDHLKRFNDTFGHLGGAKLLRIYGQVIEDTTRDTDLKARLGGDEFAVFLIGADISSALLIAERIRTQVSDEIEENFPGISWKQSVSIGLSQARESVLPENLIQSADLALYQAKMERDQTVVFSNE